MLLELIPLELSPVGGCSAHTIVQNNFINLREQRREKLCVISIHCAPFLSVRRAECSIVHLWTCWFREAIRVEANIALCASDPSPSRPSFFISTFVHLFFWNLILNEIFSDIIRNFLWTFDDATTKNICAFFEVLHLISSFKILRDLFCAPSSKCSAKINFLS